MATVLLFHHVLGLTDGVRDLAERLRAGGHDVYTPDLYAGRTFTTMPDAFAWKNSDDAPDATALADAAASELLAAGPVVMVGISMGVMQAQRLAQTRDGVAGAVLLEACVPVTGEWAFGPWPGGVPVQVHGMDDDEFFAHEGDLDAARELVAGAPGGEVFTYPGDAHLFCDSALATYDGAATDLVVERVLALLSAV
ncbi:dienelactone hydrolase family protein [Nocardioides acrostichi]|uniref:Alpha/beta fold hydrolase n=1 Tax=Nocardioides acrostichi TaxID=2784339 RepID=A0A930UYE5_9ACTN|nr:alpha/beta fold hydrolase [Nocardioides acrostichi]MBF4163158.1 alpha/beta fold hydrolase [Nocardioides acrostichi]